MIMMGTRARRRRLGSWPRVDSSHHRRQCLIPASACLLQGVADLVPLVTAWPSALTVGMSWDTNLAYQYGQVRGSTTTSTTSTSATTITCPSASTTTRSSSGSGFVADALSGSGHASCHPTRQLPSP